jgi:hypothetical protein
MGRTFEAPTHCGLTIIKIDADDSKHVNHYIDENSSNDFQTWYPASSVKFVAAILAAKRLSESGFQDPDNIEITFHYWSGNKPKTRTWVDLIDKALRPSDNIAYNELVILAGHQNINNFLIAHQYNIALNRPFLKAKWKARSGLNPATINNKEDYNFNGCKITVKDSAAVLEVDYPIARPGKHRLATWRSASCSTLGLADFLCDFIFFSDKFGIDDALHTSIKDKMKEPKPHGNHSKQENFVNAIMSLLHSNEWNVYHKPGYYAGENEDGTVWRYWVDAVALESISDPKTPSYALCAYGKEDKQKLIALNKDNKTDHQSILNSNFYDNSHLGISEAIGLLIKKGQI